MATGRDSRKAQAGPAGKTGSTGRTGEDAAAEFLRRLGYEILARNYRHARREIDIVARDGRTTVFVEVKTLRAGNGREPVEAVTPGKLYRIRGVALGWLAANGGGRCRFDVVTVRLAPDGTMAIGHIADVYS
jgi:putative endonuclease